MLTGSLAMNYYAQPRMTRDIDIVVALDSHDVDRVRQAIGKDYYFPDDNLDSLIKDASMFNIVHLESVVKVDIIVRKPGQYREHEFGRRMLVQIADFKAWIVSKEDLILSKLDWAKDTKSEMQLRDVKNLLTASPDMEYLRRWAPELNVNALLEECRHG